MDASDAAVVRVTVDASSSSLRLVVPRGGATRLNALLRLRGYVGLRGITGAFGSLVDSRGVWAGGGSVCDTRDGGVEGEVSALAVSEAL